MGTRSVTETVTPPEASLVQGEASEGVVKLGRCLRTRHRSRVRRSKALQRRYHYVGVGPQAERDVLPVSGEIARDFNPCR